MSIHHAEVVWSPLGSTDDEVLCEVDSVSVRGNINTQFIKNCPPELVQKIKTEFALGYAYAVGLLGVNAFSKDDWDLEVKPKGGFGASGTYIQVPRQAMEAMEGDEAFTEYVRSTFVHELMHHFRELEDLSMFAELIYLVEHKQTRRIDQIQTYFDQPNVYPFFTQQYIWGYKQIANALGVAPHEVADAIKAMPLLELKTCFRAYAKGILQEILGAES